MLRLNDDKDTALPGAARPLLVQAPLWLLGIITFSGTLAMHIFVPALPLAAADLAASPASMQLTISVYIFGLAVGQLLYGPISDRFGRRPVLMFGLVLYTVAGLAAALAPNVHMLIVARLFQAFGGCAGLAIARAMVRDGAELAEAAKRLALMNLMVTIGPSLAPLAGGLLMTTTGWRSILYAVCALGAANFIFAWRLLPETSAARSSQSATTIARNYGRLTLTPAFLGYAIGGGCITTSMYAYVSAAPFIFVTQLHRPSSEVGLYLATTVGGVWLGSVLASRIAGRIPIDRLIGGGSLVGVLGTVIFLASVLFGFLTVPVAIVSMMMLTFGVGLTGPAILARAISINPQIIGSASGLYGFTQMTIGAVCAALAGIGSNPALAAGIVLVTAAAMGQIMLSVGVRASHPVAHAMTA